MIIPIRCWTCGKVVANRWKLYLELLKENVSKKNALDKLKLNRYCCRRMLLCQPTTILPTLLKYKN